MRVRVAEKIHLAQGADLGQVGEDPITVVMNVTTNCQAPNTPNWPHNEEEMCLLIYSSVCVCVLHLPIHRSPPVTWHTGAINGRSVGECRRGLCLPWQMGVGSSESQAFHLTLLGAERYNTHLHISVCVIESKWKHLSSPYLSHLTTRIFRLMFILECIKK